MGNVESLVEQVRGNLPMLAYSGVDPDGLVTLRGVRLGQENVLGTHLPVLEEVDIRTRDYGLMANPHWVDPLLLVLLPAQYPPMCCSPTGCTAEACSGSLIF